MIGYELKEDEVVLYKGNVTMSGAKAMSKLVLTNVNIVLITEHKKLFSKGEITTDVYPLSNVKIYEQSPHIKAKSRNVEIYFITKEVIFTFESRMEAKKFVSEVTSCLTGKSTFERSADKVKKVIEVVDDTLGIDAIDMAKDIIKGTTYGQVSSTLQKGLDAIKKTFKKK